MILLSRFRRWRRRNSPAQVTVTITADTRAFVAAMRDAERAVRRLA